MRTGRRQAEKYDYLMLSRAAAKDLTPLFLINQSSNLDSLSRLAGLDRDETGMRAISEVTESFDVLVHLEPEELAKAILGENEKIGKLELTQKVVEKDGANLTMSWQRGFETLDPKVGKTLIVSWRFQDQAQNPYDLLIQLKVHRRLEKEGGTIIMSMNSVEESDLVTSPKDLAGVRSTSARSLTRLVLANGMLSLQATCLGQTLLTMSAKAFFEVRARMAFSYRCCC